MNTDVAFTIGSTHKICQDYAKNGKDYVVISDGCSSSPDSDFGARILTCVATNMLNDGYFNEGIIGEFSYAVAKSLHIPFVSLDATLLFVRIKENSILVEVYGDGFVYVKRKDGSFVIYEINFPSNYPFYVNYLFDKERLKLLEEEYKKLPIFKKVTIYETDADGKLTTNVHNIPLEELNLQTVLYPIDFDKESISSISIMSDGVASFVDKKQNIPAIQVIQELCAFKNTTGEAVKRRLAAFLKDAIKKEWQHLDDISIGTIFLD